METGEYDNASVVRAALRLLEQEQLKLAALRQAIAEGAFTTCTGPGQLAADLEARLLKAQDRTRG